LAERNGEGRLAERDRLVGSLGDRTPGGQEVTLLRVTGYEAHHEVLPRTLRNQRAAGPRSMTNSILWSTPTFRQYSL